MTSLKLRSLAGEIASVAEEGLQAPKKWEVSSKALDDAGNGAHPSTSQEVVEEIFCLAHKKEGLAEGWKAAAAAIDKHLVAIHGAVEDERRECINPETLRDRIMSAAEEIERVLKGANE